jgi:hypothetical protein
VGCVGEPVVKVARSRGRHDPAVGFQVVFLDAEFGAVHHRLSTQARGCVTRRLGKVYEVYRTRCTDDWFSGVMMRLILQVLGSHGATGDVVQFDGGSV